MTCHLFSASAGPEDERREETSVVAVQQLSVTAPQYELVTERLEEDGLLGLVDRAGVETDQTACPHLASPHENSSSRSRYSALLYGQTEPWLHIVI